MRVPLFSFLAVFFVAHTPIFTPLYAQDAASAADEQPKAVTYAIAGIEVRGANFSDASTIIALSGLAVGNSIDIPGASTADAIKRLWKENIFSDVKIVQDRTVGNSIFLAIEVTERPRISKFSFQGISKANADDLREKINFIRGTILTENKRQSAVRVIRNYYVEKGFFNTKVVIATDQDPVLKNGVIVTIDVNRGNKTKIEVLNIEGNTAFEDGKLRGKLKGVKQRALWRFWSPSKYIPKKYGEAKVALIEFYNNSGYRDAMIEFDTVYSTQDRRLRIDMKLYEGPKYYYREIKWVGNNKYNSEQLSRVLSVYKGDIYNTKNLNTKLFSDPNSNDVSSLYLDDGYLFFNVDPVEVAIVGDSIDLELRVMEGPQANINRVQIQGNTKTSDFVVLRELRTLPGEKFSRSDIIRSQREIINLGYFNQETLKPSPIPNPQKATVDINYGVEERPNDQLQLQGGWGGRVRDQSGNVIGGGFVGTVQLGFNNFSTRRFFDKSAWKPVPSGDGQRLNIALQMNGTGYQNFTVSFMEPWFGRKKPNSLGVSMSYMVFQRGLNLGAGNAYRMGILTTAIDLGRRLKFPDDFFRSNTTLQYKYFDVQNPVQSGFLAGTYSPSVRQAYVNSLILRQSFDRTSIDAPLYTRSGSIMNLTVEATPPYSLFRPNADYASMPAEQRFRLLEYHKWKFKSSWFLPVWKNMVLNARVEGGYIGSYNKNTGLSPFERFYVGGGGMMGMGAWGLDGREMIPLRGYPNTSINNGGQGNIIYNRYIAELRYPLTLNQSSPIWLLGFAEAGNGFGSFRAYNPFNLKRSAGAGIRVMLPMVGLLGFDWGYGFDNNDGVDNLERGDGKKSQFHFVMGQQF